ncbi:MAG: polysaccharide biosynthesis protein [Candidatus Tyrphobacter sp.]
MGRRVFLTGACGSIGRELLQRLRALDVAAIVAVDCNESDLFYLREEHRSDPRVEFMLCDIRVADLLARRMKGCDVVLHAAAYKHVDICERTPLEAVMTNVIGTQNVISAAIENDVERFTFMSSDKAVNPTSVMGTSKLMAERLVTAAAQCDGPIFTSVRFGNVFGSRGSVVPLFKDQILAGGPVTITDPAMTRFFMALESAVSLALDATFLALGGEVIVKKMRALRVTDLARVMIERYCEQVGKTPGEIGSVVVGPRAGEKLWEELTNEEEVRRTFECGEYLIVKPAIGNRTATASRFAAWEARGTPLEHPYNSSLTSPMTMPEIEALFGPTLVQATAAPPSIEETCA